MEQESRIFLTPSEAVEAVCIDFSQYGPQPEQFEELCAVLGVSVPEAPYDSSTVRKLLKEADPDPEALARICSVVFWCKAHTGTGPEGRLGIWVPTGMRDFVCIQCGRCCSVLDYHRDCTEEDVALWRERGRTDILEWVGRKPDGSYRIWVRPGTDLLAETCPWLTTLEDGRRVCSIHDCKPEICRQYPGSRKHAAMTGCPTALRLREGEVCNVEA
ncbi:YkgJ family cysteine cluster protein [Pseudodesulfovibrio tunisiensis]|uniref:YkgJ family cysteine cluster protein n=1 Tax=Pseudodesulfovibrio tunisiensis TaxID=463192 RepID=UPI001FB4775B|nr:YkgJ family cysteine cluster protein [Pseudodesulfovibrio tunisiensis]